MGFARIPVDHLDGTQILCEALAHKDLNSFVAVSRIEESDLEELWVTDTLPPKESPKIRVCSVAELFAEAIKRIHTGGSVSGLFR